MTMPKYIICNLTLLSAFALVQQSRPLAQWLDPDMSEPAGAQYATFRSDLAGGEVSYLVYLPPDYRTAGERRYPVVYWLHGLGGNQRVGARFVTQLNVAIHSGRAPAMIAVLVNGMRDSFYCDSPEGAWPVESVLIKELIPHIDSTYRTIARREARAVEGYSMGGFGAAHLGFKYPDIFGVVGVMAGALLDSDSFASRHADILKKMYGGDTEYFMANHPSTLVRENADAIRGKTRIRIAVGDRDRLLRLNHSLHELLQSLEIDHEYEVVPGVGHNSGLFYETLGRRQFAFYEETLASQTGMQRRRGAQVYSAKSLVLQRGDLEILTFETEEDYNRLQELYEETRNVSPKPGTRTTLYFRSHMDDSVQPYAVCLPKDYARPKSYPLLLQLHGLNFNKVLGGGQRNQFRGVGREGSPWVDEHIPIIVAQCFGRQSTFYQGMGEEDILEVIADVQRRFSVDPERVYLMGHSMGGAGSYTVGLHYPDRFGGILPVDAAMGSRLAIPADRPDWMKPQVALYGPENLYPNARNVNVFFKNAGAGIQGDSTRFTDGIVAEGGFSTSESFPGMPHGFGHLYSYTMFLPQATLHPIKRNPAEVKLYTTTLRYNRAYWVTLDRLTRHNADAFVTAAYVEGASLKVTTRNIDALTLRLAGAVAPEGSSATVTIDGRQVLSGPLPAVAHLSKLSGDWRLVSAPPAGGKRHGVQGPIDDALNSRFLAVYGEGDRDLAIAELDGIRNPANPLAIAGDFPMKAASKVTGEDVKTSNLILFGTPETNLVLKRIASLLPGELLKSDAGGVRSIFIHPNPENPDRYVVVWNARLLSAPDNGLDVRWVMPIGLLPDYVWVKDGKVVSGGHFDSDWKLSK